MKAAVAPVRDVLGKLGAEAPLGDHHGQDLLAESGADNVRVEPGDGWEGVLSFAPGPVGQQVIQLPKCMKVFQRRQLADKGSWEAPYAYR